MPDESGFNAQFVPRKEVTISDTKPGNPKEGDWWYDSSASAMKFYDGSTFVQPKGMTGSERALVLSILNNVADNTFENNMIEENYDDVLFDIFVDEEKISSKTDAEVVTGSEGLLRATGTPDSFEDGDISGWTGNTGTFSAGTSSPSPQQGDNYGKIDTDGNKPTVTRSFGTDVKPSSISWWFYYSDCDNSDAEILFRDTNGNRVLGCSGGESSWGVNDNNTGVTIASSEGNIAWNGVSTNGEWVEIVITNIDFDNGTFDGEIKDANGNVKASATGESMLNNAAIRDVQIRHNTISSGEVVGFDLSTTGVGGATVSSASITSTTKSLGFTPSNVIVEHTGLFDGSVSYDISDSSGNTKTVSSSEVGTEVSVNFDDGDVSIKPSIDASNGQVMLRDYAVYFV